MTEQNNAAAERSAHVDRGPARRIPGESFLAEVAPGVFQLKAVVEAERERDAARADAARLREALQQTAALFEQIMEAIGADPEETRMNVRRQPSGEAIASISVADCFRNARAALAAKEPGRD